MSRKKRNKEVQEDQEAQAPAMPNVAFDDRPADGSRYVEEHQAALAPRMPDEEPLATNEAAAIWPGAITEAVEKGELPADYAAPAVQSDRPDVAEPAEEDAAAAARAHVEYTDEPGMTDAQRAFAERAEIMRNQDKERLRKLREQRKGRGPLV